jgi:putative transposase
MMELSKSTYYSDPKVPRWEQEEMEAELRGKIESIRMTFKCAGYRPLLHYLKRSGIKIGERRLRDIMKKFDLGIKPKKKFTGTTDSVHDFLTHPNLIQGMIINNVNQVWASDITYIRIANGFVYLAVILDLYSRKVIGWAISKKIDRHLALSALKMAIVRRNPPVGVIHHSDRGVQYLCDDYVEVLKDNNFFISCSAKGNPYDNAWVERFMRTLKYEEIYMGDYETYVDVIENLPEFIEEIYNKKRLHSSLGYLSPEEFEEQRKVGYKGEEVDGMSFIL